MKKQKGMTFFGVIFFGAAIIFVAMVAIKIIPAYIEFMSVKKVISRLAKDAESTSSKKDIQTAFDRATSIDFITTVKSSDLEIINSNGGVEISIDYQVIKPIIGNVSVLLDFSTSANSN